MLLILGPETFVCVSVWAEFIIRSTWSCQSVVDWPWPAARAPSRCSFTLLPQEDRGRTYDEKLMCQDKITITGKIYLVWEKLVYFVANSKINNENVYEKEKQKLQYPHLLFKARFPPSVPTLLPPRHSGVLGDWVWEGCGPYMTSSLCHSFILTLFPFSNMGPFTSHSVDMCSTVFSLQAVGLYLVRCLEHFFLLLLYWPWCCRAVSRTFSPQLSLFCGFLPFLKYILTGVSPVSLTDSAVVAVWQLWSCLELVGTIMVQPLVASHRQPPAVPKFQNLLLISNTAN